ncbi:YndM family protein [Oceanobacillus kimchii]|uniref:Membrane protein n=1 Tax=Oceanobacillus kimchii TaxID=746691 RepID=A0ABQ5TF52_9BACI|nr:YndM family protein [Oceanobacillus kimchii]GLO65493.1 membrane protein [Oceanobacillus kimchii]
MKHLKAIGIKFIIMATILLSIVSVFEFVSVAEIIVMSAILTLAAYVIGDLWILPKMGYVAATIGDLFFSYASVWLLLYVFLGTAFPITTASIYIAIIISLTESVFHIYIKEKILEGEVNKNIRRSNMQTVQTEFAEEPHTDKKRLKKNSYPQQDEN